MNNLKENQGLIHEELRPEDHILGAEHKQGVEEWAKLKEKKDGRVTWKNERSTAELQRKKGVETNACVSYSGNKQNEYLSIDLMKKEPAFDNFLKSLNLLDKNGKPNFSDRRTAKGSGTDPNRGNTVRAVSDYMRKNLFCPEDLWPFPDGMSKDEYYSVMPAEVADFDKKWKGLVQLNDKYLPTAPTNIYGYYSTPEQVQEGLEHSPVWASVQTPYKTEGDMIVWDNNMFRALEQGGYPYGHRITIEEGVEGKYHVIQDHYTQQIRKVKWGYPFGSCKIARIKWNGEALEDFIKVGSAIAYLAKEGKYKGKYIAFEDGDVLKSLFKEYRNAVPREKRADWPANYSGDTLKIGKSLLNKLFNL